ncbi:MAG: hypothetical protein WCA08_05395, partial [Desulfoferrobacter sp.]
MVEGEVYPRLEDHNDSAGPKAGINLAPVRVPQRYEFPVGHWLVGKVFIITHSSDVMEKLRVKSELIFTIPFYDENLHFGLDTPFVIPAGFKRESRKTVNRNE